MADLTAPPTTVAVEDQDRLLDAATATVKEQAYYMRRAMESDNLRDALKYASNLICELRTSLLTPRSQEASAVDTLPQKLSGTAAEKVMDLLMAPLKSLAMGVLHMEHYRTLLGFLGFQARKEVAMAMVDNILEADRPLTTVDSVQTLFQFISPLLKDEDDTPEEEGNDADAFAHEQQQVCRLVHQIRPTDVDVAFQMLSAMRLFFGEGGLQRLAHTLVPVFYFALSLIPTIQELDWRQSQGEDIPQPNVTSKRVLQFAHKTCTALVQAAPQVALHLWLFAAAQADRADRALEPRGVFQAICNEFVSQGLICLEDAITESSNQFAAIQTLVGTLTRLDCLGTEEFDALAQKTTQHAARLLKKPMRCRAVAACSHLFWCEARKDGKRVLECLQRCLKIADTVEPDAQVGLWVEMFDKYVFFYEAEVPEVTVDFVRSLMRLCNEHVSYALGTEAALEAKQAQEHLKQSTGYLRLASSSTDDQRLADRFAEIFKEEDDVAVG